MSDSEFSFKRIAENAFSLLVASSFVGAAAIMWQAAFNQADIIEMEVNEAKSEMTAAIDVLSDEIVELGNIIINLQEDLTQVKTVQSKAVNLVGLDESITVAVRSGGEDFETVDDLEEIEPAAGESPLLEATGILGNTQSKNKAVAFNETGSIHISRDYGKTWQVVPKTNEQSPPQFEQQIVQQQQTYNKQDILNKIQDNKQQQIQQQRN